MSIARKIGNVADVLDSAASGDFFAKGSADGQFQEIAYSSLVGTPTAIDSALTSQLIDSSYIQLRQTAAASGLDSATTINLIDSSYVAARSSSSGSSGFDIFNYTATNNQTTFQDSSNDGTVLSYTENGILVYYNGLLLADEDFTATSGSSVVLASGADSGASLAIAKWSLGGGGGGGSSLIDAGPRGTVAGGYVGGNPGDTNVIEYWTIQTAANAQDFGDLVAAVYNNYGSSNGTSGFKIAGLLSGGNTITKAIDKYTISTLGNATDFGDMVSNSKAGAACCDGTYMIASIGHSGSAEVNDLERFTTATAGNASDHGDLTMAKSYASNGVSNGTKGIFAGGLGSDWTITIDQVVLATAANATDFGDMTAKGGQSNGCSNHTRGVFQKTETNGNGGTDIDYITIATPGNATDFGDLTFGRTAASCADLEDRGMWVGGGSPYAGRRNEMDYITISNAGNATNFGDLTATKSNTSTGASGAAA